MAGVSEILLIDAGNQPLHHLVARLKRLGYRTLPVKTPGGAREVLADPRRRIDAAILPPDLPVPDLRGALDHLRGLAPQGDLSFLAAGARPDGETREMLREAGVRFGLYEPIDPHTLQFLVNYCLAPDEHFLRERRTLRAPTDWRVRVRTAQREKDARLYSISANGAYLATERPMLRRSLLHVTLPLPDGPVQATGRVVMTNVPGNLHRRNLPVGMGIVFTGAPAEVQASIQVFAEERFRQLQA